MTNDELRSAVLAGSYLRASPLRLDPHFGAAFPSLEMMEIGRELEREGLVEITENDAALVKQAISWRFPWNITKKGRKLLEDETAEEGEGVASFHNFIVQFGRHHSSASISQWHSTENLAVNFGNQVRQQIEASSASPEKKEEAKSKLREFLTNDLIGTVLKAAFEAALKSSGFST